MADISVRMGELATSADPGTVLVSIGLGSCIGLALVDTGARVAGLAHIMLPGPGEHASRPPGTFADTGVAALLAEVLALGARRMRLSATIVGGAQMFGSAGRMQVGARNEEAVRAALRAARLPVVAAETGGGSGRTIRVYLDDVRVTARAAGGSENVLYGGLALPV
ncbi:MAG: chemotaxis protein CheD [Solirubrobacteraceae bacterium]|jgi:chemotaxis protein CheD|nr:chemotaxis protein CheD [Solirubrobacteraceae bacterium]